MNQREFTDRSRTNAARKHHPHVHRSYIIPVLSKTFDIMEVLKKSDRPLTVDELAKMTGIAKSTVYRILRTLSAYGYLPDGADGIYSFRRVPRLRKTYGVSEMIPHKGDSEAQIIHSAGGFDLNGAKNRIVKGKYSGCPQQS